eukprot:3161873-Heterocapsa_arctica.AAC.1
MPPLPNPSPLEPTPTSPPPARQGVASTQATPPPCTPATSATSYRPAPLLMSPNHSATRSAWANGWTKARTGWTARLKPEAFPGHP